MCAHLKLLIIFALSWISSLCFSPAVHAQLVVGGITPVKCPDDPISDLYGMLTPYIEGSGMEPDCRIYTHPSTSDQIIVPGAWVETRSYAPGATRYLTYSLDALEQSRAVYSELDGPMGSHMTVAIFFDVTEGDPLPTRRPFADTLSGQSEGPCFMRYFGEEPFDLSDLSGDPESRFKFIFAHEVGHCYMSEKIGFGADRRFAHWWREAGATYLATLVYPTSNTEHQLSADFDLDGAEFNQPYEGFVLFSAKEDQTDVRSAYDFLRSLRFATDRTSLYNLIENGMDFHGFVIDHYERNIVDPGGCSGAPCTYPREPQLSISKVQTIDVQETGGPPLLPLQLIRGGRLHRVIVTVPPRRVVKLTDMRADSPRLAMSHNAIGSDFEQWSGAAVSLNGDCETRRSYELIFTHLDPSNASDVEIPYEVSPNEDCEEPESGEPIALAGVWTATSQTRFDLFSGTYLDRPQDPSSTQVQSVGGDIRLVLDADGSGGWEFDDVVIRLNPAKRIPPVKITGSSTFKWTASAAAITFTPLRADLVGETLGIRIPFRNFSFNNGPVDVTYFVGDAPIESGTQMPLAPDPETQIPAGNWVKVE